MKNILLLTDFSENSWNAINYALKFFEHSTCDFYLLHVDKLSYLITGDIPYAPTNQIVEEVYTKPSKIKLRNILKRISSQFPQHKDHRFHTLTDYGFFIESVKNIVVEKKIDCIVMGTKGASGMNQYIIGSNTGDVITKVNCNVLAIPEKASFGNIKEIALPTDFSLEYDINTLQPLLDILQEHEASLQIIHVGKKKEDLTAYQNINKEFLENYFTECRYDLFFLTSKNIEDAIQCFVESRQINMICMVAKNLNYFQRLLFHSKVEEMSYHLEIPFLVLHEKK